jgi:hypothetical protein
MLRALQHLLETIYDVRSEHNVEHFMLTQRTELPLERQPHAADEELVVVQDADEACIGLFIDAAVLGRLAQDDPLRCLSSSNLADFWTALEGVSHFSYLTWNAGHDRGVSQLELELQAEVDKYIVSLWLLQAQNPGYFPRELRRALFERTVVNPALDARGRQLYAAASHYASRFCARVETTLSSDRRSLRRMAIAGLRRFYRLGSTRKLAHIDALHGGGLAFAAP